MFFLNFIMAGGLAVISAPVVIHLLRRRKVQQMDWGAMMFLDELVAERSKQFKAQEILLLLVRTGIVACIVVALMRPVLHIFMPAARTLGEQASVVVLMDDSYSMGAGQVRTSWRKARELALRYVDTLRKGDDVTVLFASNAGKGRLPPAHFDLDRVRELIREAKPGHRAAYWPRAIATAVEQLEQRHNSRRELVIFTDGQAHGWEVSDGAKWGYLGSAIRDSRFPINVVVANVSEGRPPNLALLDLSASRGIVDLYTPATFEVTVVNEGPESVKGVAVTFRVDGVPKATKTLDLPVEGRETVSFLHRFEESGSHYVSCTLRSADDALAEDNKILHSVMVTGRLPVLLVDGNPKSGPLNSETSFLQVALSPRDTDDPNWKTVIDPVVVDATRLRYTDFSKYRVVVLANLAAINGSVAAELERFVMNGGGVLIALGDRVQTEAYNRDLFRQGSGLLPAQLGALVDTAKEGPSEKKAWVGLGGIVSGASALDLFRPESGHGWSRARIHTYLRTAPVRRKDKARVLASYTDGSAFLIQKKMGEGKVSLLTTAVDMGWSNLPVQNFYVPLMQNLIFDLASDIIPPRNLVIDQQLSFVVSAKEKKGAFQLYRPEGEPQTMAVQQQGALAIYTSDQTQKPGLYVVAPEASEAGGSAPRTYYTVTSSRDESIMKPLSSDEVQRLERDMSATFVEGWTGLAKAAGLEAGGFEVSRLLILAAILLCFTEIYLTRRWA